MISELCKMVTNDEHTNRIALAFTIPITLFDNYYTSLEIVGQCRIDAIIGCWPGLGLRLIVPTTVKRKSQIQITMSSQLSVVSSSLRTRPVSVRLGIT